MIPNYSQTKEQRNRFLNSVARNVRVWYIKVRKMAAIYHTLNMFSIDLGQKERVNIFKTSITRKILAFLVQFYIQFVA